MIPSLVLFLGGVLLLSSSPGCLSIRVHWNTNEGPIVPPTSTPAPVPQPPYREPAPVWEIQSNDIENPQPFVYVLPPPSRPRYNTDGVDTVYATKNASPTSFGHYVPPAQAKPIHRPQVVTTSYSDINVQHTQVVPQLSIQYVANVGNRYFAIIPSHQQQQYQDFQNSLKPIYWKGTDELHEKPFGKYNAKLKKYKATETKQKFIPYYTYVAPQPQRSTQVIADPQHQQQQQQQVNSVTTN